MLHGRGDAEARPARQTALLVWDMQGETCGRVVPRHARVTTTNSGIATYLARNAAGKTTGSERRGSEPIHAPKRRNEALQVQESLTSQSPSHVLVLWGVMLLHSVWDSSRARRST